MTEKERKERKKKPFSARKTDKKEPETHKK